MDGQPNYLDCPEYAGNGRGAVCGLPAEVEAWHTMQSTDGPLQSAKIRCPRGHWFNGPIDSLTVKASEPAALAVTLPAARLSHQTQATLR
jgi:hypothetical protein